MFRFIFIFTLVEQKLSYSKALFKLILLLITNSCQRLMVVLWGAGIHPGQTPKAVEVE